MLIFSQLKKKDLVLLGNELLKSVQYFLFISVNWTISGSLNYNYNPNFKFFRCNIQEPNIPTCVRGVNRTTHH